MTAKQLLKRIYTGSDVNMLTACDIIIKQAINQQTFLVDKRPKWADPFFSDIEKKVKNAFSNILGIDNAKEMRGATQIVTAIQEKALNDLAEFKVQLEVDFKDNKPRLKEILINLGFNEYLKKAQRKGQDALIDLLFQFKLNMTAGLKTEISEAGTPAPLITGIIAYADQLKNSNITQETFKSGRKELSQTAIAELNAIYSEVIGIAKIAANFFKDNKVLQEQFIYAKVISKL